MATYIKGADTYLPDIKPFTPDYKFLSAVLETKLISMILILKQQMTYITKLFMQTYLE